MRITSTLYEYVFTFMTISRWIILRMKNVSNKSCRENQNTHFIFSNFFPKIVPFMRQCRKMWWSQRGHKWRHNIVQKRCMLEKGGKTRVHARTHNKYVIFIAFTRQLFANAPQCNVIFILSALLQQRQSVFTARCELNIWYVADSS